MKKILITVVALFITVYAGLVFAEETYTWNDPKNMSGTVWFTTDYVFRGISNTDEAPAIQGSLDYTFQGFYVGIWGSNTDFSDASIEIDYYAGYTGSLGNLDYDIMGIYYSYPEASGDVPETRLL